MRHRLPVIGFFTTEFHTVNAISRIFRIGWLVMTAFAWLLVIYLASHKSQNAEIFNWYSWRYFALLCTVLSFTVMISIANAEVVLERIYARRQGTLLFLASGFMALCLVEAFLRTADPLGLSYYGETARYHLDKMADPELIYRHRSSWHAVYQGVEVRFNEFGLRDDPIELKRQGEYRILALGDSVTFGWGVDKEKIFTTRLEQVLEKKLGRPIRVVNAGVGSYNTAQEYTFLKSVGLSFEPDLILLMYAANDVEIHKRPFDPWTDRSFKGKSPPEVLTLLLGESWFYRLAKHAHEYGWFGKTDSHSSSFLRGSQGWTESMEALKGIVTTCNNYRVPLAVFFFRWQPSPFDSVLLTDVAESVLPLPVEDVSKWFAGMQVRQYFNSQIDTHPNSKGHEVIAERIADHLLSQNLLQ